jgi:hypothetical protein
MGAGAEIKDRNHAKARSPGSSQAMTLSSKGSVLQYSVVFLS